MKVEFHDEYFIVVLWVLWVLCFLRPLLRCVGEGLGGLSRCLEEGCGCAEECGPCLGVYGQHVLLLGLFLQPALLVGAALASRGNGGSSVVVARFERWEGGQALMGNGSAAGGVVTAEHLLYEVDYLFFALPYAFAVSVSSLLLVHLSKANVLTQGSLWDDGLEEEVMVYEAAFAAELFALNLGLLAASAQPRAPEYLLLAALALTLLEFYFVTTSRFPRLNAVEHNSSAAFLLLLCVCGGVVWTDVPDYSCSLSVSLTLLHVLLTAMLVLVHFAAQGGASAQAVVAARLAVAAAACSAHLAVVLAGRNRLCAGLPPPSP